MFSIIESKLVTHFESFTMCESKGYLASPTKAYLDKHLECAAPKPWSKYTTHVLIAGTPSTLFETLQSSLLIHIQF